MSNKLTWNDLPKQIQNLMLERQFEATGRKDEHKFVINLLCGTEDGGFDWEKTIENHHFWYKILVNNEISHFYTVYEKIEYYGELSPTKKELIDKINSVLLKMFYTIYDVGVEEGGNIFYNSELSIDEYDRYDIIGKEKIVEPLIIQLNEKVIEPLIKQLNEPLSKNLIEPLDDEN